MQHRIFEPLCWMRLCWGACIALGLTERVEAQAVTALGDQIRAEADLIRSKGDFLVSAAYARDINAHAVEQEIRNSLDYVKVYFERRRINRQARAEENPNYLESEKHRQEVLQRRIKTQFQDVMQEADLSDKLNWLLNELSNPTVALQYVPGGGALADPENDVKFSPGDLDLIWLTDGGREGSRMTFRAAEAQVLETRLWPLALRGQEFEAARTRFEATREQVLKEIQANGLASDESGKKLIKAVNDLMVGLEAAYPRDRRSEPSEFLAYNAGRHYLQSLLAGVHRALTTADKMVFSGALRYQGDSLLGLIQHMYQTGLAFAPAPEEGSQRVYKKLFEGLRTIYMRIGSEGASPSGVGRDR